MLALMVIDEEQWAELLDAIARLVPNPVVQVILGSIGLVGVLIGFFLSLVKERIDRRVARERARREAVEVRRKIAIDMLGQAAVSWVEGFQNLNQPERTKADREAVDKFLETGEPDDEIVRAAAKEFLQQLSTSLYSYEETSSVFSGYPYFTQAIEDDFLTEISVTRSVAQKWVDRGRPSVEFSLFLMRQAERIADLKRTPPSEQG